MTLAHRWAARALTVLDPEDAHRGAILALRLGLGPRAGAAPDPILATELAGLRLASPIGLAAGFDKDARAPDAMLAAGFGFVECGTVTPRPQAGNPRPRLFRLTADRGVINRMGFNNQGLEAFAARLGRRRRRGVVGANIGANKDSLDKAADYVTGLGRLWGRADYFTINVSSPNTPGLRALQAGDALDDLLGRLGEVRAALDRAIGGPVFLKVAPDLSEAEIEGVARAAVAFRIDALIVGNTTLSRPAGLSDAARGEAGGLSGAPLKALALRALRQFHTVAADSIPLIGVGGIASGADAYARIRAGAAAVQLYSALVFEGPDLAARIARDLAARLRADGFSSVRSAVGTG